MVECDVKGCSEPVVRGFKLGTTSTTVEWGICDEHQDAVREILDEFDVQYMRAVQDVTQKIRNLKGISSGKSL